MTAGRTVALVWLRCQVYCRAETVDGRHNSRGVGERNRLLPLGYYRCRLDLEMCRGDLSRGFTAPERVKKGNSDALANEW